MSSMDWICWVLFDCWFDFLLGCCFVESSRLVFLYQKFCFDSAFSFRKPFKVSQPSEPRVVGSNPICRNSRYLTDDVAAVVAQWSRALVLWGGHLVFLRLGRFFWTGGEWEKRVGACEMNGGSKACSSTAILLYAWVERSSATTPTGISAHLEQLLIAPQVTTIVDSFVWR